MMCHPQLHLARRGLFSSLYDCLSNRAPVMTGLKLSVDKGTPSCPSQNLYSLWLYAPPLQITVGMLRLWLWLSFLCYLYPTRVPSGSLDQRVPFDFSQALGSTGGRRAWTHAASVPQSNKICSLWASAPTKAAASHMDGKCAGLYMTKPVFQWAELLAASQLPSWLDRIPFHFKGLFGILGYNCFPKRVIIQRKASATLPWNVGGESEYGHSA